VAGSSSVILCAIMGVFTVASSHQGPTEIGPQKTGRPLDRDGCDGSHLLDHGGRHRRPQSSRLEDGSHGSNSELLEPWGKRSKGQTIKNRYSANTGAGTLRPISVPSWPKCAGFTPFLSAAD
jgi:hypothetical protein